MIAPLRTVRLLLIEDDDDHAFLVRSCLDEHRVVHFVDRVADGEEALRYLRREDRYADTTTPDLILLDLKLPRLDGHEVLAAIKSDDLLRTIPVIVLTTSDTERDRARVYRSHANSYVVKPLDFDKFRRLIHDMINYWAIWNRPPVQESQEAWA